MCAKAWFLPFSRTQTFRQLWWGALEEVSDRMKQVESRGLKMAMELALLGADGGAGGAQLVQALLGG